MSETEKISTVAKNYADALINLASDNKISYEKLSKDLKTVYEALDKSADLRTVLENPTINDNVKNDILKSIFQGKISSDVVNFLQILVEKKRITDFPQIYAEYNLRLYEINNIQPVTIVSAIKLDSEQKKLIIDTLSDKLEMTILPEWETDSDIIAGLIIKINDNIIDTSIRNRIDKLHKSLILK